VYLILRIFTTNGENKMRKAILSFVFVILTVAATAQILENPNYVSCTEFVKSTQTGVQGGIEVVRFGGAIKTLHNWCKNEKYLFTYSCNERDIETPTLKKCDLLCMNDGCGESFANVVATSPISRYKYSDRVTLPYKISTETYESEPEVVYVKKFEKQEYVPFTTNFKCQETDNGLDSTTKGSITLTYNSGIQSTYKDICRSGYTLLEYRCNASKPSVGAIVYCKYGCLKGACKKQFFEGHYGIER